MVVSAMVVFLYGSIVWGMFPLKEEMSWEGHLFGAIAGILVAFNYRKEGPKSKVYEWPDEEEDVDILYSKGDPEQMPEDDDKTSNSNGEIRINFIYKEKEN